MDPDELRSPYFQITTYRNGQPVIIETASTETSARISFAAAVDLCMSLDNRLMYSVELKKNAVYLIERWPSA